VPFLTTEALAMVVFVCLAVKLFLLRRIYYKFAPPKSARMVEFPP
jgi:hypothetical protein